LLQSVLLKQLPEKREAVLDENALDQKSLKARLPLNGGGA
jgi:hypothetical protein